VPTNFQQYERYFRYVVLALLFAAALWMAIPALARFVALLNYPYPHDGLEGTLLYEARLLRAGQPLYQPLELYRFLSAPYPPLHYLVLSVLDILQGPHVFWSGRLISVTAAFGVALLAALIVRHSGAPWAVAILAAALVLSIPPLQLWGTRIKPDVLALLFTSVGLYCTMRVVAERPAELQNRRTAEPGITKYIDLGLQSTRYTPAFFLAILCFVAAFFTKQTAVAGPLAAGVALLATDLRDWRTQPGYIGRLPLRWRTIVFSGLYLVLTLGIWALLDVFTGGQYSVHVWWGGERSRWWSPVLLNKIAALLAFWWPQMILAGLALLLSFRQRILFVPVCYLLVAPLTLLGAGETGANHNHLLEMHLALAIAGCCALGVLLRAKEPHISYHVPVLSLILLCSGLLLAAAQVYQTSQPPEWYTGELAPADPPERYLNFIRNTPGEILADDTGLLFQAGRELRYNDPSTMGPAAAIGAWDQRGLLEDIAQKKFSAILIPVNVEKSDRDPTGRWTPEMLAAIKQHYQLKFRDRINTYVPR
jgi:Dolichyl-phosphate-mannose-protein mannosyltransferase